MKKFYTLLLSLLVCSMASAQISLTVDGSNVPSGESYTKVYASQAKDKVPGLPQLGQVYGLYPEIKLTSDVDQDVIVTIIDNTKDEGTQFCYGTTCDELYKMGNRSTKVATLKAGTPTDLAIHVLRQAATNTPYEVELLIDALGTVTNIKHFTATVTLKYDPNATDVVQMVVKENHDAPIYSVSGVRVSQPTRGLYIRNGRKFVK